MPIIQLLAFVACVALTVRRRREVPADQVSTEPLSGGDRAAIWLICLVNPIFAGAVFYFSWRKRMPVKATAANHISMLAFLLVLAGYFLFGAGKAQLGIY